MLPKRVASLSNRVSKTMCVSLSRSVNDSKKVNKQINVPLNFSHKWLITEHTQTLNIDASLPLSTYPFNYKHYLHQQKNTETTQLFTQHHLLLMKKEEQDD